MRPLLAPKLFSHSCAMPKSAKLELLESLSEFGRLIVLIAQIGTDAACCLGRSYAGGRTHQPLLFNCEHKVLLDDLAAYLFRYMYRTGTALALVQDGQPMSQVCAGIASTSLCSPAITS